MIRAAQHRVFDDMRHAGRIRRRRSEADIEHFVCVLIRQQCDTRTGFPVRKDQTVRMDIRQEPLLENFIFCLILL